MGFNGKPRKSNFKRYTNVWECNEDQNYGSDRIRGHYTPKPLLLIERIVNAHTLLPNHIVIDPFMGSGTTGVACVKLNRCFVGIEKDRETFEYAVQRIEKELH
jgi:DNA modification methylase